MFDEQAIDMNLSTRRRKGTLKPVKGNMHSNRRKIAVWAFLGILHLQFTSISSSASLQSSGESLSSVSGNAASSNFKATSNLASKPGAAPALPQGTLSLAPGAEGFLSLAFPFGSVQIHAAPQTFSESVLIQIRSRSPNEKIRSGDFKLKAVPASFEISADKSVKPQIPILVTVNYARTDLQKREEKRFKLAARLPNEDRWVPLDSSVDENAHELKAPVKEFSIFQIVEVLPTSSVSEAFAYPNPFKPSRGHSQITFSNMPEGSLIHIYTVTGALVRSLKADGSGTAQWDVKDNSGAPAASEAYLAVVKNGAEKKTLKLAVVR